MVTTLPEQRTPAQGRLLQLDGLRALALISVFCNHAIPIPGLWFGVDLFFVLSGFLITGILYKAKSRNIGSYLTHFYERRLRRIVPPYLLFLILSLLILKLPTKYTYGWYVVFSQNIYEAIHGNGGGPLFPLWSLAVEEQFYLIWPLLVYCLDRVALRKVLWTVIVISPVLRFLATPYVPSWTFIYVLTPFRADLLAAGSLLGLEWDQHRERVASNKWRGLALSIIAFSLYAALSVLDPTFRAKNNAALFNTLGYSLNVATFTGLLVYALSLQTTGIVYKVLANPVLVYLGRISYMMYLIHVSILSMAHSHLGRLNAVIVSSIATVGFASLSWKLLEHPLIRGGRSTVSVPANGITGNDPSRSSLQ